MNNDKETCNHDGVNTESLPDYEARDGAPSALQVWYGPMPESNGKSNFTAVLHKGDLVDGHTIARSEYPDRVRYEADRVRFLLGELPESPDILAYDADKHSGYIYPDTTCGVVCQAAKDDGVCCAEDECDRENGVRPAAPPVRSAAMTDGPTLTEEVASLRKVVAESGGFNNEISDSEPPLTDLTFLKQQSEKLSVEDQHALAAFIAPNLGMMLVNEPPHPDCPHERSTASSDGAALSPPLVGAIVAALGQRVRLMHPNGQDQARSDLDAFKAWADDCDKRRRATPTPSDAMTGEPVAYRHYITEPDGRDSVLLSSAPANPWSHWMPEHLDACSYVCQPLYATPPSAAPDQGVREIVEERARQIHMREHSHFPDESIESDKWAMYRIRQELNLLVAALSRPAPDAAGSEWKDISNAPKDGSKVDLLYPHPRGRTNDCKWLEGGVYGDGGWYWKTPKWGSQPGLGIDWHLLPEAEWNVNSYPNDEPTHWMRPPADPRNERGVEAG